MSSLVNNGTMSMESISSKSSGGLFLILCLTVMITIFWKEILNYIKFKRRINQFRGPTSLPFIGNALSLIVRDYEVIDVFRRWWKSYGPTFRIWLGPQAVIIVAEPEVIEQILSSKQHINKAQEYELLHPFLGNGLSTLNGSAWQARRKMLSNTFFNFSAHENYTTVFNEQSLALVKELKETLNTSNKNVFNIHPYMTKYTLNIICEAAMGRISSNMDEDNDKYMNCVHEMCEVLIERTMRPWLRPKLIWKLSPQGRKEQKLKRTLHEFIEKVIEQRKLERVKNLSSKTDDESMDDREKIGDKSKVRKAFLDLLLDASESESKLSNEDVRDETQTFIFGGHDTTASSLSWTVYLIASFPEVKEKVLAEMKEIFGDDMNRPITPQDLVQMKYLECCIKESLRMYPSGPFYGRMLYEDLVLADGRVFPKGTTIFIAPVLLHYDNKYFPDPEEFRPERFFPENLAERNTYSYVPFSAGPRTCIGQKFAVAEEKIILTNLFRHFNIYGAQNIKDAKYILELTLKPKGGPLIRIEEKNNIAENQTNS